ncbi:MAG: hypothetical protein M3Y18_01935 [Candidatus Eremiobacteraeota bacterium]|nr:hypothetical protein [Candidatus Eremiobacteraeota bacterium]
MKDALSLSQRARRVMAKLQPIVLRALTYWDHRVRSLFVSGRRLTVDPSGSYKIE